MLTSEPVPVLKTITLARQRAQMLETWLHAITSCPADQLPALLEEARKWLTVGTGAPSTRTKETP